MALDRWKTILFAIGRWECPMLIGNGFQMR